MAVNELEGRYQYERPVRVKKREEIPDPRRSELSLVEILIQRNPERAKEFLERLKLSWKPQDVVI